LFGPVVVCSAFKSAVLADFFFNDFFYNTDFFWGGVKLNYKKEKKRKMEVKPLECLCPPKKSVVPLLK
jgi:hypothetical protein